MDPLSALLGTLAVDQAVPLLFESRGAYAMRFGAYEHLKFGALLHGRFGLQVEGHAPIELSAGDCYLLTDGRPYRTFSGGDAEETDGGAFFAATRNPDGVVRLGDGPPDKTVIGGRFVCDSLGIEWLRAALPAVIHLRAEMVQAGMLRTTLDLLRREMAGSEPGQAAVIGHLAGVALVQALRVHLYSGHPQAASWLAGLADPRIGRAMRGFHDAIDDVWTVVSLARIAGMSRSTFAERFRYLVGVSPMDYVTRWRLYRVRRDLIETDRPFARIAADNGYRSRTSCSQAFRRAYGHAPADLRASN